MSDIQLDAEIDEGGNLRLTPKDSAQNWFIEQTYMDCEAMWDLWNNGEYVYTASFLNEVIKEIKVREWEL